MENNFFSCLEKPNQWHAKDDHTEISTYKLDINLNDRFIKKK